MVMFLGRLPLDLARWLLLAALVLAPWAYGCTRPWAKDALTQVLLGVTVLGAIGMLTRGRYPRAPKVGSILLISILTLGWVMALNSGHVFDPASFTFYELEKPASWLPGAWDKSTVTASMLLVTGLSGVFFLVADCAESHRWQGRIWKTIAITALSIVLLGIIQKATQAQAIFWEWGMRDHKTMFATYRYHANAGAYINLALPFVVGLAVLKFRKSEQMFGLGWVLAALCIAAGIFVNTSRAAMVVGLLLIAGMMVLVWYVGRKRQKYHDRKTLGFGLLMFAGIVFLAWAFGWQHSFQRWIDGMEDLQSSGRYVVYHTIWESAIPAAGLWGFGSGTFQKIFPFFTESLGTQLAGIWQYAHQDYLQTIMEWGYVGFLLWVGLFAGGFWVALMRLSRDLSLHSDESVLLACCVFSLIGVLLHSFVDFPLQIASIQLYVAVLLALMWGLAARKKSGMENPPSDRKRQKLRKRVPNSSL